MLRFALVAAVLIASTPSFAEKKTAEEHWTDTGLTSAILPRLVNDEACGKSLKIYRGCFFAINVLAGRAKPALSLLPSSVANDPELKSGALNRNFGALSLVEFVEEKPDPKLSVRANWLKSKAKREKLDAAIDAAYRNSAKSPLAPVLKYVQSVAERDEKSDAAATAAAINALLKEAVDAHSYIRAYGEVEEQMADASENFFGIGATLQSLFGSTIVQSPIEGSPALAAGLRANDVILAVNGESLAGLDISAAVAKIRGPEGSKVVLRVNRNGQELDITIVRGRINMPNFAAKLVKAGGNVYGVLKLRSFMDQNGCQQMRSAIQKEFSGVKGLILDLRGNGGGLLSEANCMGGLFVGRQVIVKVKDLKADTFESQHSYSEKVTDLPLVVLIDGHSASASEILSGALQDYQRGFVLGERSFGKGTVQAPQAFLGNQNILMFRTIQRFYQPTGRTNQIHGIMPDIVVPVKPDATEEDRFTLREGDLYPNALEAVGTPWQQTRPAEVQKLSGCIAKGQLALKAYEKHKNDAIAPDYQLYAAEEALGCMQK